MVFLQLAGKYNTENYSNKSNQFNKLITVLYTDQLVFYFGFFIKENSQNYQAPFMIH